MKAGWSAVEVPLRKERTLNLSSPQAPGRETQRENRGRRHCDCKYERQTGLTYFTVLNKWVCIYVTTESSSVAGGGGAEQCDGKLIALRSESQDVAVV